MIGTAMFRKDVRNISEKEIEKIVRHYTIALGLDPKFPDAYLMRGMAYMRKLTFCKSKPDVLATIDMARRDFEEAGRLEPGFRKTVVEQIQFITSMRARLSL